MSSHVGRRSSFSLSFVEMPVVPGVPPNIAELAGPTLLGYMFDWSFLAILLNQVYVYYVTFPDDSLSSKGLVYSLCVLEIAQTIILTYDAFRMFAIGFGNPAELITVGLIWLSVPVFTSIVSMLVQIFFAYRLFVLSQSKLLAIFIVALSLTQGISGIVSGWQAFVINDFSKLPTLAFKATMVWLTGSSICDIVIAVAMIYFLARRDTGFSETTLIVRRLTKLTIETGTMTAVTATLTATLFGAFNGATYYTCSSLVIAKMYAITAVVLFNNRAHFRNSREHPTHETSRSIVWAHHGVSRPDMSGSRQVQIRSVIDPTTSTGGIHVQHESVQWSDSTELTEVKKAKDSSSDDEPSASSHIKLPV